MKTKIHPSVRSCSEVFESVDVRNSHENSFKHFKCESCDIEFEKNSDLTKHRLDDRSCKSLTCPKCNENFQDAQIPRDQITRRFFLHVGPCQNLQSFVCDVCGKAFNQERGLRKHREVHTNEGEQKRLLNQLNNRARKEAIRKNPRAFPCDMCDRSYTTNQKLKFHKLSAHGSGAKFACPYCPALLMNPSTLNVIFIFFFQRNSKI